jgi:periplasmic divalent cation tolerance protein
MGPEYIVIVTTFPSRDQADLIAQKLIRCRMVACAQIAGPIESTYAWRGKVETSSEWSCSFKTRRDKYDDVEAAIVALHPYETPEILCFAVDGGYAKYLRWIDESIDHR